MPHLLIIIASLLFIGCNENTLISDVEVRIDSWHKFDRPIHKYQKLNPDRPILVLYTCDWDLVGTIALKYLSTDQAFDLFSHHRVLPLLADYTDEDGFVHKEFTKTRPNISAHCFSLTFPSQETQWFTIEKVDEDYIYNLVKTELESNQEKCRTRRSSPPPTAPFQSKF